MDIETGIAFVLYGLVLLANLVIVAQHKEHIRELEEKVEALAQFITDQNKRGKEKW